LLASVTAVASLFLVELSARLPGNGCFQRRMEYSGIMKHYCNKPVFWFMFVFYQASLLFTNLALIIQSVGVVDFALVAMFDRSCLLPSLWPTFGFFCPDALLGLVTPFADDVVAVSLGLLVTVIFVLPLSLVNLEDNINVQRVAFLLLIAIILTWSVLFAEHGLVASRLPVIGTTFTGMLGTCLFNFAFLSSVPSWVNDKAKNVKVSHVLLGSLPTAVIMFALCGFFCGMSFAPWTDDTNLLQRLLSLDSTTANVTFYLFPIVANLTSIPVMSIFQRLNLIEQGCPKWIANLIAVLLPWLIAVFLFTGKGFDEVSIWSGLIFTSSVNFIFVPAVYLYVTWQDLRKPSQPSFELSQDLAEPLFADDSSTGKSDQRSNQYEYEEEKQPREKSENHSNGSVETEIEDDGERWTLFEKSQSHLRLPLSLGVLVIMVVCVAVTLVMQIQDTFSGGDGSDIS